MIAIGLNNLVRISVSSTIEIEPNANRLEFYSRVADPRQDVYNPEKEFIVTALSTLQPMFDILLEEVMHRQTEYANGIALKYYDAEIKSISKTVLLDRFNDNDLKFDRLDGLIHLFTEALKEDNILFYYYSPMLVYNAFGMYAIRINQGEKVTIDEIDAELLEKLHTYNLIVVDDKRLLLSDKMLRLSGWYK